MYATLASGLCGGCRTPLEQGALWCGACGRRTRLRRDSNRGTVLDGTYRVEGKLAEGGFGVVYRVTHLATGLELALKVLHADYATHPQIAARFRRESRILANLRDPHTVSTFERGEFRDGTLFIAMELLRGETLAARMLSRRHLPWRNALTIVRAVCRSLAEAHSHGIVHRDLKPANVFLTDDEVVKVLDFGVARALPDSPIDDGRELTLAGQALGTLEYMAPEQLAGAGCTSRTDIYALGVIAFEMICGRRPFPHATGAASLMAAQLMEAAPLPSSLVSVPMIVDEVLMRCLQRDPAYRYETVVSLVRALDRALAAAIDPSPPRIARILSSPQPKSNRPTLPGFAVPVRGSTVDARRTPDYRRPALYVLGTAIAAVGAAITWVVLS